MASIECGQTITDTLFSATPISYAFEGTSQQEVTFTVDDGIVLILYDRLGRIVDSSLSGTLTTVLSLTGTYQIELAVV